MAFIAYDNASERILDPSYGELVYRHHSWGIEEDGSTVFEKFIKLDSHQCSRAELGLDQDGLQQSKFLPMRESSLNDLEIHHKKFDCFR